jgi:hypothetical protein
MELQNIARYVVEISAFEAIVFAMIWQKDTFYIV